MFDEIGFDAIPDQLVREIVEIDESMIEPDTRWNGLTGYLTSTDLSPTEIIEYYGRLWQLERAFRIAKPDMRIRPIYHRRRRRIEAHVLTAFVAYTIHQELERCLYASSWMKICGHG